MGINAKSVIKGIALDPGVTTGVCVFSTVSRRNTSLTRRSSETGDPLWVRSQIDQDPHHQFLWEFLSRENPDFVVVEKFFYQQRINVNLTPCEYIGVVRLYCQLTKKLLVLQSPAQAKTLVTDQKLKRLDLYDKAKPHSNDATRHMLYYLITQRDCLHDDVQALVNGLLSQLRSS